MEYPTSLWVDSDYSRCSTSSTLVEYPPTSDVIAADSKVSGTEDVFRAVVKCRKSWKTLKGGKVVWPLHLEAALLEGLALYKPDSSREALLLGRFPMRNRFISEYIFKTTGELRTAKQVGSRLQQLRDTVGGGKKLQKLLSPSADFSSTSSNRSHSSGSSAGENVWKSMPSSPTVIYIDIVAEDCTPSLQQEYSTKTSPFDATISSLHGPRSIRMIRPCLAFTSPVGSPIIARSCFTICHGDVVYEDSSPLTVTSATAPEGTSVYTCDLAPHYWKMICNSPDPTQFTIHHNIVRESSSAQLFSATYRFRYVLRRFSSPPPTFSPIDVDSTVEKHQTANFRGGSPQSSPGILSEISSTIYDSEDWHDQFDSLSIASRCQ
ncbi:hypothetical protein GYMLUDRAFT_76516 [Collybiopsis luxurians FD-317 M1]|uniref:TEA domain-containing protein n=1 Tax=Collybiopsis luxurians FD-317 M1 TaxID=944289 RepID=A0A0D0BZR0_9AGAR|nr:hypothetical protein GYMLUDRAFT_76516 [Collybiopsis luxurians FD-317 M1]